MNERIKELIKQATSTLPVNHEGYGSKGYIEQVEYFDKEKFAELIVLECMKVADDRYQTMFPSEVIAKHFGVE